MNEEDLDSLIVFSNMKVWEFTFWNGLGYNKFWKKYEEESGREELKGLIFIAAEIARKRVTIVQMFSD